MSDIVLIQPKLMPLNDLACLPLGLLSISRNLHEEGYRIKIINQIVNHNWEVDLRDELKKDPICVGVSAIIGYPLLGGIAASEIVKENSNAPTIWGGPHPSILPRQTLENENIDIICEGEGDITFPELVKTLEKNKPLSDVKGIWYKDNGRIVENEKRPLCDLNTLPALPFDLIDMKEYKYTTWYKEKDYTIKKTY